MRLLLVAALALFACAASPAAGFYIPGIAPRNFKYGELVELKVNKVTSVRAQLPFSYYSLPVCKPETVLENPENLGEVLSGDVIENSAFVIKMMEPTNCAVLCENKYSFKEREVMREKISNKYLVHWIIDSLPSAMKVSYTSQGENGKEEVGEFFELGFPLGLDISDPANDKRRLFYLYNHFRLRISVHSNPDVFEGYRVVRFEVEPFTVVHKKDAAGKVISCTVSLFSFLPSKKKKKN